MDTYLVFFKVSCKTVLTFVFTSLLFTPALQSQKVYSDKELLQNAVRNHESRLSNISSNRSLSLPDKQWIDQMEFRTEFNQLDLDEQEYVFRMRFRNDKVRRMQNQLLQMKKSYLENESISNFDDNARSVYNNIIRWHFNQMQDSLINYKLDLIKDKNAVETTLFQTDNEANFNDILKIKERAKNVQMELFDLDWELQTIRSELGIESDDVKLKMSNLIAIEAMQGVIENLDGMIQLHPTVQYHDDRIALIDQEYKVEESDKENLLRFAQLKYKADDKLALEREFSVGFAFTLPYKRVNQGNLAELELDKIEEGIQQSERILELQIELGEEKLELVNLIEKFSYLKNLIEEENLGQLKEEYLSSQRVKPLPLVNLELMIVDRQIELLQARKEVFLQYISALESIGALRFRTNTNFLNQGLQPIE